MSARLVVLAACVVALMLAGADIATASSSAAPHKFFGGVVPDVPTGTKPPALAHASAMRLPYGGGPVLHSNRTHVIFWQPAGSGLRYEPGYESLVETFLRRVTADSRKPTNVYSLSGQYRDAAGPAAYNTSFAGAVVTNDPLPPNGCSEPALPAGPGWTVCLSDAQLEHEIEHVISAGHLPTRMRDIYFLVMPNGMGTCETSGPENCALGGTVTGSFCGYHSNTSDSDVLYAVIPYNAISGHCQSGNPRPNGSTADPALSTLSHEHNETVTDPLGNGYIDNAGNEDGDLCIQSYGPRVGGSGAAAWNEVIDGGHYWLQAEWSNVDNSCQARTKGDPVSFNAPAKARAHKKLTFIGHAGVAGVPGRRIVAYNWFFGDGRTASHRIASHTYSRAGMFRVVLRTTDNWGNWAFATHTVRVAKAPAQDRKRAKSGR